MSIRPEADPVDRYFPDLSVLPPQRDEGIAEVVEGRAEKDYREQRGRYQRGLLKWLHGDAGGAAEMQAAVEAFERAAGTGKLHAFWWAALGFFDALTANALPHDVDAKRLCSRIDQQMRRMVDGAQDLPERLLRELLYHLARAQPVTPHLRAVQEFYRLEDTLPAGETAPPAQGGEPEPAREALTLARDAWNHCAAGNPSSLAAFVSAADLLRDRAVGLANPEVEAIAREIALLAAWLTAHPENMSEAIVLEVETALLVLDRALANPASLGADLAQQSQFVCARLRACVQGRLLRTAPTIPLVDEMARRAQKRLLLSQVAAEIRVNLRSAEQALAGIFRDPEGRGDPAVLGGLLHKVGEAFDLLGEPRARDAVAECDREIARLAQAAEGERRQEDFERIAGTLSGLRAYVEALAAGEAGATVEIGGSPVPRVLFEGYASEARSHLRTMARERDVLAQQAVVSDAFMRAAQLLGAGAATVGLDAVAELARVLEQTLQAISTVPLSEVEAALVGEVVGALATMIDDAASLKAPGARPDLIDRLRRATLPALVKSEASVLLPEEEGALEREPDAP